MIKITKEKPAGYLASCAGKSRVHSAGVDVLESKNIQGNHARGRGLPRCFVPRVHQPPEGRLRVHFVILLREAVFFPNPFLIHFTASNLMWRLHKWHPGLFFLDSALNPIPNTDRRVGVGSHTIFFQLPHFPTEKLRNITSLTGLKCQMLPPIFSVFLKQKSRTP